MSHRAGSGFGTVLRAQLRTGWLAPVIWVLALAGGYIATVAAIDNLYGTPEALASYNELVAGNPAMAAINGTPYGADTLGGVVSNEFGFISAVAIPLMGLLLVVRQTRAQEERGMLELLRSRSVGARAPWTAALLVSAVSLTLVGLVMALTLIAYGEDADGAILYGASIVGLGLVFSGIAIFAGQLLRRSSGVTGVGVLILGIAYITRAIGDVRANGWKWLSPLAWQQETKPFTDDLRLWPLLLALGVAAVLVTAGLVLVGRRDLGSAMVASRPGPGRAGATLRTTLGIATRTHVVSGVAWAVGTFAVAVIFGAFTDIVADAIETNPEMAAFFPDSSEVNEGYVGFVLVIVVLMAMGYMGQSLGKIRAEEAEGRLEVLLAGSVSRYGWSAAHFGVSTVIALIIVMVGGAGLQLTASTEVDKIPESTLAFLPAVLVVSGLAFALFALLPRSSAVIWLAVGYMVAVSFLGNTLSLPDWALNLSPLYAVGNLPSDDVSAGAEWILLAIAVVLIAVGFIGFRRRDVPH
ncbi:ABC transporter membrane-spanning protein [Microbacterium awajiense]|uniref:ABC transporter membrane-spanning protein n=1 Tax=Microbacterium awajiense TaxID=415214 RepID=A0ABP7ALU6_9MICO